MKHLSKIQVVLISILAIVYMAKVANALTNNPLTNDEIKAIASQITVKITTARPLNPAEEIDAGSGVILPSSEPKTYYVLTAKHVASFGNQYTVITYDGIRHQIAGDDVRELPNLDLAWLKFTSRKDYIGTRLGDSDSLNLNEKIYIYGWPNSSTVPKFIPGTFKRSLSQEVEKNQGYSLIYNAVQSENGMSGGPILNKNGHLVGIHGRYTKYYQQGISLNTFLRNSASGLTWMRVCNQRSPEAVISFAIAKYIEYNKLQSEGWYVIQPGLCTVLHIGEGYRGKIYWYAEINGGENYWGKDRSHSVCVNKENSFEIVNSTNNNCNDSNLKEVPVIDAEITPGLKTIRLVN